jgi:hypothetical protein
MVKPAQIQAPLYPFALRNAPATGGPKRSAKDMTENAMPNLVPIILGSLASLTKMVGCKAKNDPVKKP